MALLSPQWPSHRNRSSSERLHTCIGSPSSWKLETGNWKLATGDSKLETGNWKLETGNWQLETLKTIHNSATSRAASSSLEQTRRTAGTSGSRPVATADRRPGGRNQPPPA